jgi:hypothetical protein
MLKFLSRNRTLVVLAAERSPNHKTRKCHLMWAEEGQRLETRCVAFCARVLRRTNDPSSGVPPTYLLQRTSHLDCF